MGADLFLNSIYFRNRAKYEPEFHYCVAKRDALKQAGKPKAAEKAQLRVWKLYDKMYERGYFRDSYNSSSLLWLFDLSWWQDVLCVLTEDGHMSPENAGRMIQMLKDRESAFEANLKKAELFNGETKAQVEQYFRDKYQRFMAFLQKAIDRNESIECSL